MSKWISLNQAQRWTLVFVILVVGWIVYNQPDNYKANFRGLPITIEFRKGDVKSGTDVFGNQWSKVLKHHYGYFDGIEGADGQELDVYINPDAKFLNSSKIFRIEQLDTKTGEFDEYKIMLGFSHRLEARQAYLSNMPRHWDRDRVSQDGPRKCGIGVTSEITLEEIK
jgi:hypothetical protein